jgi:hypothetical protein
MLKQQLTLHVKAGFPVGAFRQGKNAMKTPAAKVITRTKMAIYASLSVSAPRQLSWIMLTKISF